MHASSGGVSKGGSTHIADLDRGMLGANGIVGAGTTDGGLGRGWCGIAAGRGEEAWACAAQVGDDVVDDAVVSDEAQDAQASWAGWTG